MLIRRGDAQPGKCLPAREFLAVTGIEIEVEAKIEMAAVGPIFFFLRRCAEWQKAAADNERQETSLHSCGTIGERLMVKS